MPEKCEIMESICPAIYMLSSRNQTTVEFFYWRLEMYRYAFSTNCYLALYNEYIILLEIRENERQKDVKCRNDLSFF